MPAPAKVLHTLALLAKEEVTFNTAIALTAATDGVQLQYKDLTVGIPLDLDWAFDGNIGPAAGSLGQVQRAPASGLSAKGALPLRFKGGGAAYSGTVVTSLHKFLKASGFDAAVVTTASAEKWTFTPTAAGSAFTSLTLGAYGRGELCTVSGVTGSIKVDAPDLAPPIWTFTPNGAATLPADAAIPAITYPLQTVQPPIAAGMTLTLGNLSANAVVLSSSWDMMRNTSNPRVAQSAAGGHLSFVPGDRVPTAKVVLESTALVGTPFTSAAAFDPYNLRDKATTVSFVLQYGTAQYNRIKINQPQSQVIDVKPGNNGPTATMELTIAGYNSTAVSNDDVNIVTD